MAGIMTPEEWEEDKPGANCVGCLVVAVILLMAFAAVWKP
jgi:hypothetical protein